MLTSRALGGHPLCFDGRATVTFDQRGDRSTRSHGDWYQDAEPRPGEFIRPCPAELKDHQNDSGAHQTQPLDSFSTGMQGAAHGPEVDHEQKVDLHQFERQPTVQ